MPYSRLFPLDIIKPGEILSQYAEWIYFTILLVFFVSISGITLRRHFSKPYIRPLIISVGLMLTVGVFMMRNRIVSIFEGWGMLGTFLLLVMAATVPYGLCRGFGLPAKKAFYLTYILFYILSWVKFPEIYYGLAERNLGLVNLGLLILCIFSAYKMIKFGKSPQSMANDLTHANPFKPDIERELDVQNQEKKMIKRQAGKITAVELHTLEDIASELAKIQRILETDKNSLSGDEKETISQILKKILKKETLFKRATLELAKTFERIQLVDSNELHKLKQRLERVSGKEKNILQKEIDREKEKIRIEKAVSGFQSRADHYLYSLNASLDSASVKMGTGYPYDAHAHIVRARIVVKDLMEMIKEVKAVENKLLHLIDIERSLMKKERKAS